VYIHLNIQNTYIMYSLTINNGRGCADKNNEQARICTIVISEILAKYVACITSDLILCIDCIDFRGIAG
jgi:hypothetical protein